MEGEYGINRLFWFDELFLQNPGAMERANWYGGLQGYPYMRIDGSRSLLGAYGCDGTADSLSARINARISETGGLSPMSIAGTFSADASNLRFDVTCRLLDPLPSGTFRASFIALENDVVQSFPPDTLPRIAQAYHYESLPAMSPGDSVHFAFVLPKDPHWNPDHMWGIAFVQDETHDKQIIQGAILTTLASSATPGLVSLITPAVRFDGVRPNPFRESAEIRFTVLHGVSAGEARLDILDPSGRSVIQLIDGSLAPGTHAWTWDGRDAAGRQMQNGVYFLRLKTPDGVGGGKITLLR